MPLPSVPTDIAKAISAYGAAERAFARRCALEEAADAEIDAVIDTAIALDVAISRYLASVEAAIPLVPRIPAAVPLHPQWRDYLPS